MAELMLICGSMRAGSTNAAALRCAAEQMPAGWSAHHYLGLAELPHFNPDDDVEPLPPAVARLRGSIDAARALLFCTPEYAGALPGSLKNLLDWTIGGNVMAGKPVGWINASDRGAAGAYAELQTVLGYADTQLVPTGCVRIPVSRSALAPDGAITDPEIRAALATSVAALCSVAE